MKNKRFKFEIDNFNNRIKFFDGDNIVSAESIEELLNNYYEGYESLKKQYIQLRDENHRLRLAMCHIKDLNFDIEWLKENINEWKKNME